MSHAQFLEWRKAYEAAGISDAAPPSLRSLVAPASLIVASDAPRAVASALALSTDARLVTSPLLRELALIPPNLGPLRLPLMAWALTFIWPHFTGGVHLPEELARARAAAQWLDSLANENAMLPVVTHGSFRSLLAKQLVAAGWSAMKERARMHHWSVIRVTRG